MKLTIAFIFFILKCFLSNCEGENIEEVLNYDSRNEYGNSFRTVPTLFEYILNLLIEHPEVLERNDIGVFTNGSIHDDDDTYPENISNTDNAFESVDFENNIDTRKIGESDIYVAPIISAFQLSSEEVMEQILIIEQQLDKYNSKKSK